MPKPSEISVRYKLEGQDTHLLMTDSEALSDIRIDHAGVPGDLRGGSAVKLLCASCLYCFASTLSAALVSRNVEIKSLTGQAKAVLNQDANLRIGVAGIKIEMEVDINEEDIPALNLCRKLVNRGCLVTNSLKDAIDFQYEIRRVGE